MDETRKDGNGEREVTSRMERCYSKKMEWRRLTSLCKRPCRGTQSMGMAVRSLSDMPGLRICCIGLAQSEVECVDEKFI
jgi:hypothetical protein